MWPFKRATAPRTDSPVSSGAAQIVARLLEVAENFSALAAAHEPATVYDLNDLPHSKELIEAALFMLLKLARMRGDAERAAAAQACVMALAQYQPSVGVQPVRALPDTAGLSAGAAALAIAAHADSGEGSRWKQLSELEKADQRRYLKRIGNTIGMGSLRGELGHATS